MILTLSPEAPSRPAQSTGPIFSTKLAPKPFRINTCGTVSKQSTLSTFRINTYKKPIGGVAATQVSAS